MKIVKIPKKKRGEFRTIYIPNHEEKLTLKAMVGNIDQKVQKIAQPNIIHGFSKAKSPVTNAKSHCGFLYSTCFDLKDFFDTVKAEHLNGKLSKEELDVVLVDGSPRQGLPTSPAVANLAAVEMDKAIQKWIKKNGLHIVYTRYADDLTFSYNELSNKEILLSEIPKIISRCGFIVNPNKTRTMSSASGRRIITGIAVDDTIHPTRAVKRKLRAAQHQNNESSIAGLSEWCKLKSPQPKSSTKNSIYDLNKLAKVWRLRKGIAKYLPEKQPEESLGDNCFITPDPIYMLGMSSWTSGWTSCMRHPGGTHHAAVWQFVYSKGTRLAVMLDNKTQTVAGITRKNMLVRVLVHELENGQKIYGRFYGDVDLSKKLEKKLIEAGYVRVSQVNRRIKVVGAIPINTTFYSDNLHKCKVRIGGKVFRKLHT